MNKKQGLLIGTALVLLFTGIALATSTTLSASSDVIIYAFDQNPAGRDEGNEWITLYNPSNESVDIGNWTLQTADGERETIPKGTTLYPFAYYIYSPPYQWLDNTDEAITLSDAKGEEVDKTPVVSDNENDNRYWMRNNSEWVFGVKELEKGKIWSGYVKNVVDGDTVDVSFGITGIQRIRLVGVNTPEIGEEGYEEANEFVTVSCSNPGDQIYMILRLLCCVTGAAIVIAQIFSQIGWSPRYRRIRKAVQQMRGLSQAIKDEVDNKIYTYEAGFLDMNDAGFKELVNVLKWKRLLPEGEILEMALYHGNLPPNFKATMLSPNAVMGVIYRSNSGKNFRPIIFHPFDIGVTLSLEELKNWTKEYLIVRMGYLTSILVVIWTTIGLIAIFKG